MPGNLLHWKHSRWHRHFLLQRGRHLDAASRLGCVRARLRPRPRCALPELSCNQVGVSQTPLVAPYTVGSGGGAAVSNCMASTGQADSCGNVQVAMRSCGHLETFGATDQEKWIFQADGKIRSVSEGMCLSDIACATDSTRQFVLAPCDGADANVWLIREAGVTIQFDALTVGSSYRIASSGAQLGPTSLTADYRMEVRSQR